MSLIRILGTFAGLFGTLLIVLPAARVAHGRLELKEAIGLWLSGVGFVLLALAALVFSGEAAHAAVLGGVSAAVAGNIVQRQLTKSSR